MKDMREIAGVGGINTAEAPRSLVKTDRLNEVANKKGVESRDPVNLPAGRDRVTIDKSAEAAQIAAATKQAAQQVRSAQVAEIEAAVRKGLYQPDPRRIAQKILDDAELMARIHVIFNAK